MLVTASHQLDQDVFVSFDKEALKQIASVAAHPLFSSEANWVMVSIVFKHNASIKRLVSGFKNDFTKTDNVKVQPDMVGGEVYELHEILISGTDREPILSIDRSQIANAASMDLTLASNAPTATYVDWSDWNNGPLSGDYIVIADGGIYGGWNQSWEWLKSSNINFNENQSGSVTFVVNSMPYYFGFGMGFGGQPSENVGFVKHSGSDEIMINVFGYVPNTPIMALNPGQNTFKIEKVGSAEFKLYVNGTLFHTIENNTGNTFSASLRNRYTAQGTGLISSYRSS